MYKKAFDSYWKRKDILCMSRKFDDLWDFLPADIKTVVDLGGGNGAWYQSYKNNNLSDIDYCVVDYSAVAGVPVVALGGRFLQHDIDAGPTSLPDNSADMVILSDTLEHVTNPWALLAEATRISKKYVFVRGPNFASLGCRWDLLRGYPIRQMSIDKNGTLVDTNGEKVSHIHFITYTNLLYWAKNVGLHLHKKRVFWYRRFAPVRPLLEYFFSNWGERYDVLFVKNDNHVLDVRDQNLKFH